MPGGSRPGPAGSAPSVQIFGRRDSRSTQAALRFFRERRLTPAFVDLAARPIAPAELRRFSERYGAAALLDTDSRGYRQAGHGYLSLDEQGIFARLLADQSLLRLPLVRAGRRLTIGRDEGAWQAMVAPAGQAGGIG